MIAELFNLHKWIYALKQGNLALDGLDNPVFERLKTTYILFVEDILGLREEAHIPLDALLEVTLRLYSQAKEQRRYDQVDAIRADLRRLGIALQDTPQGVDWSYEGV